MPTIKRSIDINATSQEAEQNKEINSFIRRGFGQILPRNLQGNETILKMFQRDDDDQNEDGGQNGGH